MTFWSWNGYKVQKGLALGTFKVIGCNFHSQFTLRKVMVLSAFKTWAFISKWGKGIRSKNNLIYNEFSSKKGKKEKSEEKNLCTLDLKRPVSMSSPLLLHPLPFTPSLWHFARKVQQKKVQKIYCFN